MAPRTRRRTGANKTDATGSHTVADCLEDLGITSNDVFADCDSLEDEFRVVKKIYFAAILEHHPDKGGDAATFRKIRTAFEVLRELKTNGSLGSFTTHLQQPTDDYYETVFKDFGNSEHTPSYEHYYHAAQEQVPGYKVELAKSGRSQCVACKSRKSWSRVKPPPKKRAKKNEEEEAVTETSIMAASEPAAVPKTNFINKDSIRIGSLDETSGSYGRWHHLDCWRVPYRIWAGLTDPKNAKQVLQDLLYMDEVLLTNLVSLNADQQAIFVAHVMDHGNWARKTAASKPPPDLKAAAAKQAAAASKAGDDIDATVVNKRAATTTTRKTTTRVSSTAMETTTVRSSMETSLVVAPDVTQSTTLVKASATKEYFVIPRPGVNGAIANVFSEKKFVLTGLFPEVGGGTGLNLGKDRVKAMIESFGGSVTSSISGKTHYLVVGKEPGRSKVSNAKSRGIPMVDLKLLQTRMLGQAESLESAGPPPRIESFSAGYGGRYLMD